MRSQCEHIHEFQLSHEGVSEVSKQFVSGASKRIEHSNLEHCGAKERREQCERTNVVSDRVAC